MTLNRIIWVVVISLTIVSAAIGFRACNKKPDEIAKVTDHSASIIYRDKYVSTQSNKSFDSMATSEKNAQVRYDLLKSDNSRLSKENATLKQRFNNVPDSDTGEKLAACKELVQGYESEINGYVQQIYECDSLNKLKDAEIMNRQFLVDFKSLAFDSVAQDNKKLANMAIKMQPNWFQRNWLAGIGVGIVGGLILGTQIK